MKQVNKKPLPKVVLDYLSANGIKGGSAKTEKKCNASRKNGCAPCRPGKFRGRPLKKQVPFQTQE